MRHARTRWNRDKLIQGQNDSALTQRGREQAKAWGRCLKPHGFDQILVSDLGRSLSTAEAINRTLQLPMAATPDLRELDWGDWTGKRIQDIRAASPDLLKRLEAAGWQFCPPGGESREEAWVRARGALQNAAQKWPGKTILAVAHEGIIKCLLYKLTQRAFLPPETVLIRPYHLHWLQVRDGELFVERVNAAALDPVR